MKWVFFKNGISPREFAKCMIKDIQDITDIEEAIESRGVVWGKVKRAMSEVRF